MSKLAPKVATFLFATMILGASYLTCFLRALPVSAATIPMQHNQNYAYDSVEIPVSHSMVSPSENHDNVCKVTADSAVFETKTQRSDRNLSGLAVINTPTSYNDPQIQHLHFNRFSTFPSNFSLPIGSATRRE